MSGAVGECCCIHYDCCCCCCSRCRACTTHCMQALAHSLRFSATHQASADVQGAASAAELKKRQQGNRICCCYYSPAVEPECLVFARSLVPFTRREHLKERGRREGESDWSVGESGSESVLIRFALLLPPLLHFLPASLAKED